MVCIGGDAISAGGCGMGTVRVKDVDDEWVNIDNAGVDDGKMIFFIDNGDHKFTSDTIGGKYDTVYEVSGGGGEFPEDACMWVKDGCPSGWVNENDPGSGESSKIVESYGSFGLLPADSTEANARKCCAKRYGSGVGEGLLLLI